MNVRQTAHRSGSIAPGHVLILLELHVFPHLDQCAHLENDLNTRRYFLNELISREMIESYNIPQLGDVPFRVTERGRIYIASLMRVRLPVKKWVPGDE